MELFSRDPLMVEIDNGQILVRAPRAQGCVKVSQSGLDLILSARNGLRVEPSDSNWESLMKLLELGLLVEGRDSTPCHPWLEWGAVAWQFHQTTSDVPFQTAGERVELEASGESFQTPSGFPSASGGPEFLLPRVEIRTALSFEEVLTSRRTHRDFDGTPVTVDVLAQILRSTFGPLRYFDAGANGVLELRAPASGGARHEAEGIVVAFDVVGLVPGVYRYDGGSHSLVEVPNDQGSPELRGEFENLINNQGFADNASFGIIVVAVTERLTSKYDHARTYRVMLQDTGHVAQVFAMMCTAMGVGASMTGAFKDTETALFLDLPDGVIPTFAMTVGYPILNDLGLPRRLRVPLRSRG